ncbi:hypothetical protein [Microvirga aerophila]|uniref:Uncharacterized protein n=1 Tax=Microvirga aerophila TaxID=670291 RepID=A0A512BS50_9HYPH|nr:hypothetical protein [Microvirga aerophila]GEO14820.1 hypothetical protein MAE02_25160 [Microvirga aerophila]
MDALPGWAEQVTQRDGAQEELWLLGQPPLHHYLDYVQDHVIDGKALPRSALVDEWRTANDYYYDLEISEAGIADKIGIHDLPQSLKPLENDVRANACFRRSYDMLPTRFAMVELERLVVAQLHVNLTHTNRLRQQLPAQPGAEEVFRFCHPIDRPGPQINIRRISGTRYSFTSDSSDLRFREAALLRSDQIAGGERFGPTAVIMGLVVGFSSNFLTAIQSDNRLLLHNGHHRAFALLDHGVTHAPCIIQTVTRRDELNLIAGEDVQEAPAFYFKAARPPLLKDFLDPRIRKVQRIPRPVQMIDIKFEVQDHNVAD